MNNARTFTRQLGQSGMNISPIGLGGMSLSGLYGQSDDRESLRLIQQAFDLGINFIDTADVYGLGHNENLFGRAMQGRRAEIIIGTKFGLRLEVSGKMTICGHPDYVAEACEASLRRLGVDVIDLYYLHRVDPNVRIEETTGAMARLVEAGKVRAIGLSEAAPATIRRAHAVHPITAVQTEYSLFSRDAAEQTLPTLRELGIYFVAYSPLGRGILADNAATDLHTYRNGPDYRELHPRFSGENFSRNLTLVKQLAVFAEAKGCTVSQLALAWLRSRGEDIIPIPGTKRLSRLEENWQGAGISISAEECRAIEATVPSGAVAGLRQPEDLMPMVQL